MPRTRPRPAFVVVLLLLTLLCALAGCADELPSASGALPPVVRKAALSTPRPPARVHTRPDGLREIRLAGAQHAALAVIGPDGGIAQVCAGPGVETDLP